MQLWIIFFGLILVAGLLFGIYEWYEHAFPKRQWYAIKEQKVSFHMLLLSDLHRNPFLMKNQKFLQQLQKENVDFICIAGDVINKYDGQKNFSVLPFLQELSKIAPVYYSYGNHESRWRELAPEEFAEYRKQVFAAGIHFLDNETVYFRKEQKNIQITGCTLPQEVYKKGRKPKLTKEMLETVLPQIMPHADYSILLAHSPEYIEQYKTLPVSLVCSGHLHGGLIRLPLLGGIVSPQLRLAAYTKGLYHWEKFHMLVSAGLGSHTIWVRIFNRTEYICLDIEEYNEKGNTHGHTGKAGGI